MKVALVTRSDVAYALDLAGDLRVSGVEVDLYLCYEHTVREFGTDDPVGKMYDLGLAPRGSRLHLMHFPRRRDPRSFAVLLKASRQMRRDAIDVAHILAAPDDPWLPVLPGLLGKTPSVATMIVPEPNLGEKVPKKVGEAINWLLARTADVVVVNGVEQVELVRRRYGAPRGGVRHVPLGVHRSPVNGRMLDHGQTPGTVIFFGDARPHKGLEYLIRAQAEVSARVPHAKFLIVAHGDGLHSLRAMMEDSGKFEVVEAYIPRSEVPSFFERASVVVLPYLTASTSGVLMTAYGMAKPVVATTVGCLPEYVEDGLTGLLVPPADESRLAKAIVRLLSDDALRQRMTENIPIWVKKHQAGVAARTLEAYAAAGAGSGI